MKINIKHRIFTIFIDGMIGLIIGSVYMVIIAFQEHALPSLLFSIAVGVVIGHCVEFFSNLVTSTTYFDLKKVLIGNFFITSGLTFIVFRLLSMEANYGLIAIMILIALVLSSTFITLEFKYKENLNEKLNAKKSKIIGA